MSEKRSFSIIGPGKLGNAVLDALVAEGYPPVSIHVRSEPTSHPLGSRFGQLLKRDLPDPAHVTGKLLFITVPDDAIQDLAREMCQTDKEWAGVDVIHCSGCHSSDLLLPLKQRGARIASFHPLQTFVSGSDRYVFHGITISLEGENTLVRDLAGIVRKIGASPLILSRDQKRVMHIAAVLLSNYTVSLARAADELIREEIPDGDYRMLLPLLQQTVRNLAEKDLPSALTGPVARGDADTVAAHLQILNGKKEFMELYKILGNIALRISSDNNTMEKNRLQALKELLKG